LQLSRGELIVEIHEKCQDGLIILALKGRLDSNTSSEFEKKLLGMVEQGGNRFILDFKELDYISSAGLRVLIKAVKELKTGAYAYVISRIISARFSLCPVFSPSFPSKPIWRKPSRASDFRPLFSAAAPKGLSANRAPPFCKGGSGGTSPLCLFTDKHY
jgi:anti-anti-sigma factor